MDASWTDQCFVGIENTSDMSSKSSVESLLAAATERGFFDDAMPVVVAELLPDGEYELSVVVAANTARAKNPKINRRFMETSVWFDMQGGLHHPHYAQRRPANVVCLTYQDLVLMMMAARGRGRPRPYAEISPEWLLPAIVADPNAHAGRADANAGGNCRERTSKAHDG